MIVQVDPDQDQALQTAQMANALVGTVEAHASRAEDAYRQQGADPADLVRVGSGPGQGPPRAGPGRRRPGRLPDSAVELIGRAEAGRLVERWRDDSDGRVIQVRLTGDGERRLSQLAPAHLDELRRLAPILDQLVVGGG